MKKSRTISFLVTALLSPICLSGCNDSGSTRRSGSNSTSASNHEHTFTDVITPATYDAGGYTTHTCNICGYSYIDSETPQLVHHYSENWSYDEVHHWHACIDEGYEDLFEDAKDHEMTTSIVSATNDHEGYTLHSCECGYSYKDSYTQATNKFIFQLNSNETGYGVYGYDGKAKDLVIPSTHNSLPVLSVGDEAFMHTRIVSLTIPNSVTSIGDYAFSGCISLTSITIPNSVTSIGRYAFRACKRLTSITIPNSVTSIDGSAFYGCTSLTSIIIPNSVTSIGESAFCLCTSLTSIIIPNSVTSIGRYAFNACKRLTSITIPDSVTNIGNYAFEDCTSLEEIIVDENNQNYSSLNGVLFNKDKTRLIRCPEGKSGDFVIPNGVETITSYAFNACKRLISITIPNSVTSIDGSAFYGCTSLTSIIIPNSVTSIGDYAFSGCISLTSIIIPDSVTYIDGHAFSGCISLTSITIPNGVETITSCAFYGCTSLTSITIPDSVTNIGNYAFYGCSSLTSIVIPNSVTYIGFEAFYGCSSLTSIIIPDSVTYIGGHAFEGCLSLSNAFYCGSPSDLSISPSNETLISALCYYSADEPTDASYRYWHYVDGVPTIW